ncbi:MAG: VOC family protein [candidate division Zixibacteria bacterium]|nr:VOC family protein [candidate division Zixibacteria bacterium]
MSGIVFFGTNKLDEITEFYFNQIGCDIWLEQADCKIFRHDNFLLGFCTRKEVENNGIITFFFSDKNEVDRFYNKFKSLAETSPIENEKYKIYHFFIHDPEGRKVEFQYFNNDMGI